MKTISSLAACAISLGLLFPLASNAQSQKAAHETPKLVVGIMVDQMRSDYIQKYWDKFGEDGFKRLVNEGFTFTNNHFDYMPTSTGPGHASVYTGTTPAVHGVMGNGWYVRETGKSINVIEVPGYTGVGTGPGQENDKAPSNLLSTTVGDELRLHSNFRSKVIGISRKDRGAILPAGHTGEAYWYDGGTGHFISSSYYFNELPAWVKAFNARNIAKEYLKPWETLLPIEEYVESMPDDNPYENLYKGETAPVFPHNLPEIAKTEGLGVLSSTPFHNDILLEMAIAAIEGEKLGSRSTPDLLAISFSATDAVGHQFGPSSVEVQDTYRRLDRTLAKLLNYLDDNFGKENILLFLTSDHAVSYVTSFMVEEGHAESTAGMFMAMMGLMSVAAGPLWGWLSDFWGRGNALTASLALVTLGMGLPLLDQSLITFFLHFLVLGLSVNGMFALIQASATDQVAPRYIPIAFSFVTVFFASGQLVGPAVAGWLIESGGGFKVAFGFTFVVLAVGVYLTLRIRHFPDEVAVGGPLAAE